MRFPNKYKQISDSCYSTGEYKLVPIRYEDRFNIMKWRNEQIYHLRQQKLLTVESQNKYYDEIVASLFEQDDPSQLLFSYLKNEICIGYGGLVHIDWSNKNAEISFIMDTSLEKEHFKYHWSVYLSLLEKYAFSSLNLNKIYTYAFDLRPHLYEIFEDCGFFFEARLKRHILFENRYIDVVIHSKFKSTNYG